MNSPKVSIIMPTYNVELYLPSAIESVLYQSFSDWELLIVNDGSTDNSFSIAKSYASKDERIKVLNKDNGGLSDARNFGLQHSTGTYIHFFDSDDIIEPNFYSVLMSNIENSIYDVVICGYYQDFHQKNSRVKTLEVTCEDTHTPFGGDDNYFSLLTQCFNYAWNKLFRKKFLIENSLTFKKGLSIIEDKEFMSRVIKLNPYIKFIKYLGYRYQIRNRPSLGSSYSSNFVKSHLDGIDIQYEIFKFFNNTEQIYSDMGIYVINTSLWVLNCIYSSQTNNDCRLREMIEWGSNQRVTYWLNHFKSGGLHKKLLKFLLINNRFYAIHVLYMMRRLF